MANSGTYKYLGTNEVVEDALKEGVDTISVISKGNYLRGIALEIQKRAHGKRPKLVNLTNLHLNETEEIPHREIIVEKNRILRYEAERAAYVHLKMPDAGKVKDYTDFQLIAYCSLAYAILTPFLERELKRRSPDQEYISLGVGSGRLFLALADRIRKDGLATKLIGVLPKGENGVFNDHNLIEVGGHLYYKSFSSRSVADKLACPYTLFKPQLLQAITEGHQFLEATNDDFFIAWKVGAGLGCQGEQSASAGFVLHNKKNREKLKLQENALTTVLFTGAATDDIWKRVIEN